MGKMSESEPKTANKIEKKPMTKEFTRTEDFRQYKKWIFVGLGISPGNYPDIEFSDGYMINPYKKDTVPVLLVPVEIFHKLPLSKSWEDMSEKPDVCKQMLENDCKDDFTPYNPENQTEYSLGRLWKRKEVFNIFWKSSVGKGAIDSLKASMEILTYFKNWVENNKGWEIIQEASIRNREKITQRIIHLSGLCYIQTNNLDMSCEPDEGRGPVDFKVSRGQDITIIEVKLSTNPNYCHGYKTQIEEYGKAEHTNRLIYVLIDMGNPGKVKTIERMYAENLKDGRKTPEVLIVNAARRESASIS